MELLLVLVALYLLASLGASPAYNPSRVLWIDADEMDDERLRADYQALEDALEADWED